MYVILYSCVIYKMGSVYIYIRRVSNTNIFLSNYFRNKNKLQQNCLFTIYNIHIM